MDAVVSEALHGLEPACGGVYNASLGGKLLTSVRREWLASSKKYHDATYNAKPIPPFEQPVTRTTVLRLDIVADQQERHRGVAVHVV